MSKKTKKNSKNKNDYKVITSGLTIKLFEMAIERIEDLIPENVNDEQFKYKQFIYDVITKNYKIKHDSYKKICVASLYFVFPFEDIIELIFGRFSLLFMIASTPIDEYFAVKYISVVINEELEQYLEFINQDRYKPASTKQAFYEIRNLKWIKEFDWVSEMKSIFNNVQEQSSVVKSNELVDLKVKQSKDIDEVIIFTELDYKRIIEEYMQKEKEQYVKIDYDYLKKHVIFGKYFDIIKCQEIVQNKMGEIIESSSEKLHTYKLKKFETLESNYLFSKEEEYQQANAMKNIEKIKGIKVQGFDNILTTLAHVVYQSKFQFANGVEALTIQLEDFFLVIDQDNNFNIRLITENVVYTNCVNAIEKELNKSFKSARKSWDIPKINKEKNIINETDYSINIKIEQAINKFQKISANELTISHKEFTYSISNFQKEQLDRYLILCQKNENIKRVGEKDLTIIPKKQEYNALLVSTKTELSFEGAIIKNKIEGQFTDLHLILLQKDVFEAQVLEKTSSLDHVSLVFNCGEGVVVNVDLAQKKKVKIVDMRKTLSTTFKKYLQNQLEKEIVNHEKIITRYC